MGAAEGLSLPANITVAQYSAAMLAQTSKAKISCIDEVILVGHTKEDMQKLRGRQGFDSAHRF